MYQKNFLTTYKDIEDEEISLSLYKSQLIQAFNIKTFDEIIIANKIDIIEKELNDNSYIQSIKEKLLNKYANPLINSENLWKSHSLYIIAEYFYSKNEKQKAKEFFEKILEMEDSNPQIKIEAQKRLQRDFSV